MPILIDAEKLTLTYTARPLFQGISLTISTGERIGLIGPNGAGKSTLLKILAGRIQPDEGRISTQKGLKIGFLEQIPTFPPQVTVRGAVMKNAPDEHDWESIARCEELLSKLSLTAEAETPVAKLSGGWQKRVALARELLIEPDLLLLDEPTNHLDVESILWLEDFLASARFATVTITHDRVFLQRISNRILELDRRNPGGLLSVPGDYATYLETKTTLMSAQEVQEERLRNTLRRETEWLRQGAKARTTKQQARIHRAEALGETVSELTERNRTGRVGLDFQATERNPKKLIDAQGIQKSYGDRRVIPPTTLLITAKSRIGLLGVNGCGKSTLIRLLLGTEAPDSGTVIRADGLQAAYFEQNRESLDPRTSLMETLCPRGDHVDFRGSRIHIRTYLSRFLFSSEQMEMAVGKLSGGEQARVLLARLMLRPANILILDEPTNDLDMATLDVLQEVLAEFPGAVILVTHDRYFLDQVASQILAFDATESGTRITPYASVSQWEDARAERIAAVAAAAKSPRKSTPAPTDRTAPRKLGFKEQRELDSMESNVLKAEARLAELTAESARPEIASHAIRLQEIAQEMAAAQAEIDRLYRRWEELSE